MDAISTITAPAAPAPAATATDTSASASATTTDGTVRLRGVTKRYGEVLALDALDLDVRAGEFLSILGPSGSGKTTTMRVIGGFEQPDAGVVEISGVDVRGRPPFARDVNTVFQSYALFPHMTVLDNVAYGLRMKGVGKKDRRAQAAEMLEMVQLGHAAQRRPGQLSGGMQQRVALARALVNNPSVLLLDEPLGALDRKLREDMQVELRRIQTTVGITFVYVTHDQEEALSMSDRLVVMRDGRIEQLGTPGEVYDNPETLWVSGFVGTSSTLAGRVTAVGTSTTLDSDHGLLVAAHRHGALAPGAKAVVVVRPEDVEVAPGEPDAGTPNCVHVVVEELLNVGSQLKVVARLGDGGELLARVKRGDPTADALTPGRGAWLRFAAEAAHVYPTPATPAETRDERA
ncbi:MAG TPA: ABC transporter ATP-binding protein [Baekduia sp.]|nr:ABC transporter ATP-binding protein [Baekduia sp.]